MSNKALSSLGAAGQDLLVWALEQEITGGFYVDSRVTTENNPFPDWWGTGLLLRPTVDIAAVVVIEPFSGRIAVNHTDMGQWMDWKYLATATPPKEYDLPITGVSDVENGNSRYSKNDFGEVICQISITPGEDIPSYTILAMLPEGFRPTKSLSMPAMIAIDGTRAMGQIGVNSSGEIGYYGATVTAGENSRIYASFSFVADI